ncbi:MAG: MBL fold metallo-hydrolase [Ketobacteraceae bacterium]|nr:MBL fold metallo-hydrolase [Ketobacteraceae bacterium]
MSQFEPGKLVNLSRLVHRVVAPNAGMMTGPGTNTYLIGNRELAVIDPGPADQKHIDAIVAAAADLQAPIRWILCTHTHVDHSPGTPALAARTGATVYGQPAAGEGMGQDQTFKPDIVWGKETRLVTGEFTLQAVHTPGHASNHWCYLLEDEQLLFTGDHIMEGSTVVIAPPDGNMGDYLRSLEAIKSLPMQHIAPGHGELISHPADVIEGTIQHRLMRENKTLEKLAAIQPATMDALVAEVYDEVPIFLHSLARYSLQAHLDKLVQEGRVTAAADTWELTDKET